MTTLRNLLLVLAVAAISSFSMCCSSPPLIIASFERAPTVLVELDASIWDRGAVGMTTSETFWPARPLKVQIVPVKEQAWRRTVIAHELIHVLGVDSHPWDDDTCVVYHSKGPGTPLPTGLCRQERDWLRRFARPALLSVTGPIWFQQDVAWAVEFLNREIGRVVLRVVD